MNMMICVDMFVTYNWQKVEETCFFFKNEESPHKIQFSFIAAE